MPPPHKYLLAIAIAILLLGYASADQSGVSDERILFVGNSLTYYNDVPAMVDAIYSALGQHQQIDTEMLAQGGYSLADHLDKGVLKSVLAGSSYDVVVLQDFGGWPLCSKDIDGCAPTPGPLAKAVALVRSFGARPIWYSTYQSNPEAQRELSREARRIASRIDVDIADVGAAMLAFSSANTKEAILLPNHHPDTLGSWIAAATIVRSLYGKPLPHSLALGRVCRQVWQDSALGASRLASEQQSTGKVCNELAPNVIRQVIVAVNQSSNTGADKAGASQPR